MPQNVFIWKYNEKQYNENVCGVYMFNIRSQKFTFFLVF